MRNQAPFNIFVGFKMTESEAKKLYGIADLLNVPIGALIRHIIVTKTNNFTDFDEDVPVTPIRTRFIPARQIGQHQGQD